ncbi:MAG: hypothetical protein GY820_36275 [Gammaproteobacteria bacterium]|nr:hypothetical protein [Gammaproteobacteria bacterium]
MTNRNPSDGFIDVHLVLGKKPMENEYRSSCLEMLIESFIFFVAILFRPFVVALLSDFFAIMVSSVEYFRVVLAPI